MKFEINDSDDGQYYFNLKANNGEVVATSEMYTTKQSCSDGINSVKQITIDTEVIDNTIENNL